MTKETREKVAKIMELALLINGTETQRAITGDKPTVFVDFEGHVATLYIRICDTGWESNGNWDREWKIGFSDWYPSRADEKVEEAIDEVLATLKGVAEKWVTEEDAV